MKNGSKSMSRIELEVCIDSVESAMAAHAGGAGRVELCSALSVGGVTPSAGLIQAARFVFPLGLFVLIRPCSGDFSYTAHEFEVMRDDVRRARDLGADGVALGVLTPDGRVDVERTAQLVAEARPMKVTFHRAFDVLEDLDRALEDVICTGADRILTSGGERQGVRGVANIARLVRAAQGRIVILGGGGIRNAGVREFVLETGVQEVHTSLRSSVKAPNSSRNVEAILGADSEGSLRHVVKDSDVQKMRKTLDDIAEARNGRSCESSHAR